MSNTVTLPEGLGKYYSYMNYEKITAKSSNQYQLRETAKSKGDLLYDSEGYAKINGRYVVALTSTFGGVGDYVDIKMADGSTLSAIIGDIKNQNDSGANQWGHNEGQVVVEYITNWNDYHSNPKGNGGVLSISNLGNYNTTTVPEISGNNTTTTTSSVVAVEPQYFEDEKEGLFYNIVLIMVLLFIGVVGVWFFLKAFNIDLKKYIM